MSYSCDNNFASKRGDEGRKVDDSSTKTMDEYKRNEVRMSWSGMLEINGWHG